MRILAISGSLRARSSNTSLLRALVIAARAGVEVVLYPELELIPPFNPDREGTIDSPALVRFREALREASAVVFSTPEYAHGVPGVLKNALDWVVGSGELSQKPVALANASSRGAYAQASLKETLATMNARVVSEAEITVELTGKNLDAETIAREYADVLQQCLKRLA